MLGVRWGTLTPYLIGAVAVVGVVLWAEHSKRQAVHAALEGMVAQVALDAALVAQADADRRAQALQAANAALSASVQSATADAAELARQLEEFAHETPVPLDCRADPDLLRRLRAN